jgi:hypothetical protein
MLLCVDLRRSDRRFHRHCAVVHAGHGDAPEFQALHPVHGPNPYPGAAAPAAQYARRDPNPLQGLRDVPSELEEPHRDPDVLRLHS